jgi:hypothetical protein
MLDNNMAQSYYCIQLVRRVIYEGGEKTLPHMKTASSFGRAKCEWKQKGNGSRQTAGLWKMTDRQSLRGVSQRQRESCQRQRGHCQQAMVSDMRGYSCAVVRF